MSKHVPDSGKPHKGRKAKLLRHFQFMQPGPIVQAHLQLILQKGEEERERLLREADAKAFPYL